MERNFKKFDDIVRNKENSQNLSYLFLSEICLLGLKVYSKKMKYEFEIPTKILT